MTFTLFKGQFIVISEYFEVATQVYANVSSKCYNTIRDGYAEAQELLSTPEGSEKVKLMLA